VAKNRENKYLNKLCWRSEINKFICIKLNLKWRLLHAKHLTGNPEKLSVYKLVTQTWPPDCHDRNSWPKPFPS